jgi:uncharacterized protein YkwD
VGSPKSPVPFAPSQKRFREVYRFKRVHLLLVMGAVLLLLVGASASLAQSHTVELELPAEGDVTQILQGAVDELPPGTRLRLPSGRFRMDGTITIRDKTGVRIEGSPGGRTVLYSSARGEVGELGSSLRRHFLVLGGSDVVLRRLHVEGQNTVANQVWGYADYERAYQHEHGFAFVGVKGAVLEDSSVTGVFGDGVYVGNNGHDISPALASEDVTIQRVAVRWAGRNGVTVTNASGVALDGLHVHARLVALMLFPNARYQRVEGIDLRHSTLDSVRHSVRAGGSAPVSDVRIEANTVTANEIGQFVKVNPEGRSRGWSITQNVVAPALTAPGLRFYDAEDITVSGNDLEFGEEGGPAVLLDDASGNLRIADNRFIGADAAFAAVGSTRHERVEASGNIFSDEPPAQPTSTTTTSQPVEPGSTSTTAPVEPTTTTTGYAPPTETTTTEGSTSPGTTSTLPPATTTTSPGRYSQEELRFVDLLNDYRRENGLAPLLLSDVVSLAAERHSQDMGKYEFFSHQSSASDYFPIDSWPWDRMVLSGYSDGADMGENIAAGMATAESVLLAWKTSPPHNEVMLSPMWAVIGIALEDTSGPYRYYWTSNFGSGVDPSAGEPPTTTTTTLAPTTTTATATTTTLAPTTTSLAPTTTTRPPTTTTLAPTTTSLAPTTTTLRTTTTTTPNSVVRSSSIELKSGGAVANTIFRWSSVNNDQRGIVGNGINGATVRNIRTENAWTGMKIGSGAQSYNIDLDGFSSQNDVQSLFLANVSNSTFRNLDLSVNSSGNYGKNHAIYLERGNSGLSFYNVKTRGGAGQPLHLYHESGTSGTGRDIVFDGLDVSSVSGPIVIQGYERVIIRNARLSGGSDFPILQLRTGVKEVVLEDFEAWGGTSLVGVSSSTTDRPQRITLRDGVYHGRVITNDASRIDGLAIEGVALAP